VPPPVNRAIDRFFLLSETLEGDVLQPVWFTNVKEVEAAFGPGSYPVYTSGRFRYHWFLAWSRKGKRRTRLAQFWFYVCKGWELHREKPYDCILAYSHMTTGMIAGLLKLLTRGKLVIEVATTPRLIAISNRPRPSLGDRLRKLYSDASLHVTMALANRVHLLYPAQLDGYRWGRRVKASIFHEFVPISTITAGTCAGQERYVLLIGTPWYLKGVDRLVEAFQRLAPDFPEVKLKIVGWYLEQERKELEALRGNCRQIEIVRALPNQEALKLICGCTVLVHPSRCEGGPSRVVMEGLAAGVPVIGSDVAGIPYTIRDGENGFIVPGDDTAALERRLRELLSDPELRRRLGERGYRYAHDHLTERVYVEQFTEMVRAVVRDAG